MGAALPPRAGPTRLRSWPLTLLKGMSLGPDTPWRVGGRASGVPGGREMAWRTHLSKECQRLRGSRTFPQAHPPLPSLHSLALIFHIFSFFSLNACITQAALLSPTCDEAGGGWMDGQAGHSSCG